MLVALCVVAAALAAAAPRYSFYRALRAAAPSPPAGAGTRRVFGGQAASLEAFPGACALLDRYWAVRCSGAVLTPRWVLTAAHCVTPRVAYVKYNARRARGDEGNYAPVYYLYRHPKYAVVQEDEGRGMDVTLLHHDVGLVCTRTHMALRSRLLADPVAALRRYDALDLRDQEVEVLGFGHTEPTAQHEELALVRLQLVYCERGAWFHCVCGSTRRAAGGAAGEPRGAGVCAGDSGGPVVYRGVQVAITSMGPMECSAAGAAGERSTSVFTSLYRYADLVNATIADTESALRMSRVSAAPRPPPPPRLPLLGAALAVAASRLLTAEAIRLTH